MLSEQPLSLYTSFRIGGPAQVLCLPATRGELMEALQSRTPPVYLVGNGTNLLAPDEGVRGTVIVTTGVAAIRRVGDRELFAECGASLARLADVACRYGLSGLEFAAGIPGTVGGAVVMNAGAYGGSMADVVVGSEYWRRGGVQTLDDHAYGYRSSAYTRNREFVVLGATFRLTPGKADAIRAKMEELQSKREATQPLEWPSAGSVFKRPPDCFVGPLIEQCGLKGWRVGGAQVSEKHAGFIINRGGATCQDVLTLVEHIQKTVRERTGVCLEMEIQKMTPLGNER